MANLVDIGLHAYGQRDPLVMYYTEGHKAFLELLQRMQHDVVHSIFHATITQQPGRRGGGGGAAKDSPMKRFNSGQSSEASGGKKIGRNAPCPCGSGKKYKRCCGANV